MRDQKDQRMKMWDRKQRTPQCRTGKCETKLSPERKLWAFQCPLKPDQGRFSGRHVHDDAQVSLWYCWTVRKRTIMRQYGDWYTGPWCVDCYIWYNEEGPWRDAAPPSPLLAVPNVAAHVPSTASVPTSHYSMWQYNYLRTIKG